jgi:hypothetical protein
MKARIFELNNDDLARVKCSHVYQIWEDGEITLQKCGPLLWARHLHMMQYGEPSKAIALENFPHRHGEHGYAYVTKEGADEIRKLILEGE